MERGSEEEGKNNITTENIPRNDKQDIKVPPREVEIYGINNMFEKQKGAK